MADFLLIVVVLAFFAFGWFIMWRIDKFLDDTRKRRYLPDEDSEEKEDKKKK